MKPDEIFIPSVLKVIASAQLDVSADLRSESTKSISELLDEEKDNKEKDNTKEKEDQSS